jgi:hypothetical protein
MENINSILRFCNAYELIKEASGFDLSELSEEETDFLESMNEYECFSFYLINDETVVVCDGFSGDVSGNAMNIEDFTRETINYVLESCRED